MSDDLTVLGVDGIRRSYDEHYDTMMDVEQDPTGAFFAIQRQADRIEELEAKLAKAVERLEKLARWLDIDDEELAAIPVEEIPSDHRHMQKQINAALAELKGEK